MLRNKHIPSRTATKQVSIKEFDRLPVGPPNFEYEEGKIIAIPSPTPDHQDVVCLTSQVAARFVREHKLGRVFMQVDVYLPDGRVYVPDVSFLSADRLHLISPINQKIYGAPELCVEVVSQDIARDRVKKFRIYLSNGVLWYWLIDPDTLAIEEYSLTSDGYIRAASVAAGEIFHPGVFPGLEINLVELLGITLAADSEEQTPSAPQAAGGTAPSAESPSADGTETGP